MRLFVAVEFEDSLKDKIFEIQKQLIAIDADVKWVEKQNFHITLKFLGEIDDNKLSQIISGIEKATSGKKEIEVSIGRIGVFPDFKNPRVVWLGVKNDRMELNLVAENVENELNKIGIPESDKKFSSHLTLGRIRSRKGIEKLIDKIKFLETISVSQMAIKHIVLMKSTLTPKGPVYTVVKYFNLS